MKKEYSAFSIMYKLIGLIKPLLPLMILAITLGVLGFLCAIFLTVVASYQILELTEAIFGLDIISSATFFKADITPVIIMLISLAVFRGILHYGEQYCNHFIAFKLLAIIRNKVFSVLRELAPAKLDGKDKGNLISIITSDIELLEVFYAHTISPIFIAIITSSILLGFLYNLSPLAMLIALVAYVSVGLILPLYFGRKGRQAGQEFRDEFGDLNNLVLESLRGLNETIQYNDGVNQLAKLDQKSDVMLEVQKDLNNIESQQRSITNLIILISSFIMFFGMLLAYQANLVSIEVVLIGTVTMMGSFGPVVALSNLSNNLHQTLASGQRVLSLLAEKPLVEAVTNAEASEFGDIEANEVSFAYDQDKVLDNFNVDLKVNQIIGIHGKSGSGKSTFLKLLMRFYDVDSGEIKINKRNLKTINTEELRSIEAYVTQSTYLFKDTIANNIRIAKLDASEEEVISAAKKASIHEFIMSLPEGYETKVSELGSSLSGGEKQRIAIARAFLSDSKLMLLDEPTSNLDILNESIILKALKEHSENKTIVLVSHRKSTMSITDTLINKA